MKKNLRFLPTSISVKKQIHFKNLLLGISFFIASDTFSQNPLWLSSPVLNGQLSQVVSTKTGSVFYSTTGSIAEVGLWSTDGTRAGAKKLIMDDGISTAVAATMLTPLGNDKILLAGDNTNGHGGIWVSDGTQEGTFGLQNFTSSSSLGAIHGIISINNTGICAVVSNDDHLRLVTTDGLYGDVAIIQDFGVVHNTRVVSMININNIIYFIIYNGDSSLNDVLWRTDGTISGTFQLKDLGATISPLGFIGADDAVYFMMWRRTLEGDTTILFKSDGSASGTIPLKKFNLGLGNNINPNPFFTAIDNTVYFSAYDDSHGKELWKSDGTEAGTTMIADINSGVAGSNAGGTIAVNNVLYFDADDGVHGPELWKYDVNSIADPQLVKDIYSGSTGSGASYITAVNNTIVFSAGTAGTNGPDDELWVSDGTAAHTIQVSNFKQYKSPQPHLFAVQNNNVFFAAKGYDINGDGINKEELLLKYTAPDKIWTGNISSDVSDANNWLPSGAPVNTDDILIPPYPVNNLSDPILSVHNFWNNSSTINVGNGQILISNDFYNAGTINNTAGVFTVAGDGSGSVHNIGAGTFNGQLTLSNTKNIRLTGYSKVSTLRVEGADTVFLGDYDLVVDNYPMVLPAMITDGWGSTYMPVDASPVTFPVGSNATSSNPVTLTNNGASGYFGVNVKDGVYKGGYGYSLNAVTQQVVNKTWDIKQLTYSPDANLNITLQWNASDELPGFNRNNVYLNHFTLGAWDSGTPGVASGSGPFTFTRSGFTSFSPFAISSSTSALPVTLISFNANKYNNTVQLNWQTTSEINASFYAIERSADGNTFSKLGQVSVLSNSAFAKNYSYTDVQPLQGTNFYRLKMVDADGKFAYSKIVAIKTDGKSNAFQIYPNPARNILNVQVNGNDLNEEATLQIIDIAGRKVKEEKINLKGSSSFPVDVSQLPKGTYHLLLKSISLNEQGKFVKE